MNTHDNTVLITGGSAGISFALAQHLAAAGNRVIITGRSAERLQQAAAQLPGVQTIISDVTSAADVRHLVDRLNQEYPALNMVINNAGAASVYRLATAAPAFENAEAEMLTNYLAVIRLTEQLLPLLLRQPEAAVVNVSSIAALVPNTAIPTYSASKAALHSYTQSLRFALADTAVKVFELLPPLVDTDFSEDIGGSNGIAPAVVAQSLHQALVHDQYEVRIGKTEDLYQLMLTDPAAAFKAMNFRG